MKRFVSWMAVSVFALGISASVRAQGRITLLTPDPLKEEVDKIVEMYTAKTGQKVQISYGTGVTTRKTVGERGALDVTLLFAPFDEALKTGNVDKSTQTVVARVRLAVHVKKGSPKVDISNAEAVKKLLMNAKSIATVDPNQGSVGGAALLALNKMGITDQVKSKIHYFPGGGEVQKCVADGECEVGLGPYVSDIRNPGVEVLGPVPVDGATPIDITAWVSTDAENPKAAMALIQYLKSKDAAPIWKAGKVFPVDE